MWTDPGNISIAHRHMSVEIGTERPEKEYVNGIFVAVRLKNQDFINGFLLRKDQN